MYECVMTTAHACVYPPKRFQRERVMGLVRPWAPWSRGLWSWWPWALGHGPPGIGPGTGLLNVLKD